MSELINIDFPSATRIWFNALRQDPNVPHKVRAFMQGHIENHVMRYFRGHTVADMTGHDLQRLRWSLTCSQPLAQSIIKTLRRFFDFCVSKQWVSPLTNPAKATITAVSSQTKWWRAQPTKRLAMPSYEQLQYMLTYARGLARTALHIFVLAGLRGNEARALRKRHCKPPTDLWRYGRIDIRTAFKSQEADPFQEGAPKTRAGQRFVNVGPTLACTLDAACADLAFDDYILNINGNPLTHQQVDTMLRREQARLGVGSRVRSQGGRMSYPGTFGIRHLRHAFVAVLIFMGFSDRDIAEVVGHSSSVVTLDIYGYLFELYESAAPTWPGGISPDNDLDTDLWELAA